MNDKITKLILGGKEYLITDKQAQQILDVISDDVEQLKKDVEFMSNPENLWKVVR
jgi:hypothetical protein